MWDTEWRAVSQLIEGLLDGGKYLLETAKTGEPDNFGITDQLIRQARRTVEALTQCEARYGLQLPASAQACLHDFLAYFSATFPRASGWPGMQGTLGALAAFRAEFQYLLTNTEAVARSLVDRAFVHLQRSLIVDAGLRGQWQVAFREGEAACEGLGAVHLLLHGVWAFKVSGTGERTDLVLGTPIDIAEVQSVAQVLILTEWKAVRSQAEVASATSRARRQAALYAVGVLGGIELTSRRYIVVVSHPRVEVPPTERDGDIEYRYLNIAVEPGVPSRS